MIWELSYCGMCGILIGEIITGTFILMILHKKWYNTYWVKKEHLPFTPKIKEKIGMKKGEYLK